MERFKSQAATWAVLVTIGLHGSPLSAQTDGVQAINEAAIIDVPMVLDAMEPAETAGELWAKGEKPANPLLARFSMKPVEVATMDAPGSARPNLLWRAVRGGTARLLGSDDLREAQGARYFCGSQASGSLACFIDQDGDGSFDHVAEALTERGLQPYHITIIKAEKSLPASRPYRILGPDQRPAISVELRNCAKDYDRPRYAALSVADRAIPMAEAFVWHEKDSSFASCRRGSRVDAFSGGTTAPAGGYLAQIGPLAFAVGPKNAPKLTLLGPVDGAELYRLEGNSLVPVSVGHTPGQAKLVAMKKFPYPSLMTDAGAVVHDGTIKAGERLASIPFHHGYRGKLTQDISVSTLFGSRSVAAGTVVYGFPAKSQISTTVNGIPGFQTVGDEEYRKIDLQLTWCAPIHSTDPIKQKKPNALGQNGWSAACIPHSKLGNYTILTDLQPAFSVSGVSYDVNTSSNDGMPPIERDDQSAFDQPLRIDYVYEGREGEFISLSERVYFGGELTSSAPKKLYAPAGKVGVKLAGTSADLTVGESGDLTVASTGPTIPGSSPLLKWDQQAHMLQQLQKLGLRMQPSATNAAEGGHDMQAGGSD